jgi:hypothetical protein
MRRACAWDASALLYVVDMVDLDGGMSVVEASVRTHTPVIGMHISMMESSENS